MVGLDRWASKPSFGRGRVRVGQMGSKKLPLGLKHMGGERGGKKKNHFHFHNKECNKECGKLVEDLPTYHLPDETRARIALWKMLDED